MAMSELVGVRPSVVLKRTRKRTVSPTVREVVCTHVPEPGGSSSCLLTSGSEVLNPAEACEVLVPSARVASTWSAHVPETSALLVSESPAITGRPPITGPRHVSSTVAVKVMEAPAPGASAASAVPSQMSVVVPSELGQTELGAGVASWLNDWPSGSTSVTVIEPGACLRMA